MLKVRCGSGTYVKPDGSIGTAGKGALMSEDVAFTLATRIDQTLFAPTRGGQMETEYVVRRLTPLEAERLQGFPDHHTDLTGADPDEILARMPQYASADEKGKRALERKVRKWCKECPDGPRYKAIGNAFAVPVVRYIGEMLQKVDSMES